MGILAKIFTWWDGATIGTLLFSARNGVKAGSDEAGNVYYHSKDGSRRWVIYNGPNDASRISPDWHGWLHGTHDGNPEDYLPPVRGWEQGATGNLTGTSAAYRPAGALESSSKRARATGDYEAWSPGE
ncbi:MAG: NADH:ubiquinone oxidoreductase subunit NDUFA12 [Sphingomonadales bacterium]|nr:NADH:ubiquinone oxidoreductase subunit NDUFA12 [Sphingomonadales bacterium]